MAISTAWQRLQKQWSAQAESKRIEPRGLRIEQYAGWEHLLAQPTEDWVARYEAAHHQSDGLRDRGAYYTPWPMANYLTRRTLMLQRNTGDAPDAWRIGDPACGSGVFLLAALQWLTQQGVPVRLALRQLHGIDRDPLAVAVTEARLIQWAETHQDAPIDEDTVHLLAKQLVVGDTLLAARPHAPWDVVLGNPPYVSEVRGQATLFRALKASSPYYQAKMDLCDAFLAWSLDQLAPDGTLGLVLPEYWMQRSATATLRERLWTEGTVHELWLFGEHRVFGHAPGHHSSLLIWQRQPPRDERLYTIQLGRTAPPDETHLQTAAILQSRDAGQRILVGEPDAMRLLARLSECPPLLQAQAIQQGVVMPQGRLKARQRDEVGMAAGFLFTDAERAALALSAVEAQWLRPYYEPARFEAFSGFGNTSPDYWLLYADAAFRANLQTQPLEYARLKAHLDRLAPVNTSALAPYGLHRPRQPAWFSGEPRIYAPRQVSAPRFAVVPHAAYVNEGFYIIKPSPEEADWTAAVLNSRLAWFWLYHQKRKGHQLQIDKDVLKAFPRPPHLSEPQREHLGTLARRLADCRLSDVERQTLQARLDEEIGQAYGLDRREYAILSRFGSTPSF